jgi:hypothetical protein
MRVYEMGSRVVIRGDRGQYEILLDGNPVGPITTKGAVGRGTERTLASTTGERRDGSSGIDRVRLPASWLYRQIIFFQPYGKKYRNHPIHLNGRIRLL